jgi:hypothetical protein
MMIGTEYCARNIRHSAMPSSPGSIRSRITSSKRPGMNACRNAAPSATAVVSMP